MSVSCRHIIACLHVYTTVRLIEDVDLQVMTFDDFGKNVPKTYKLSPDGFVQNAIQLAFYK